MADNVDKHSHAAGGDGGRDIKPRSVRTRNQVGDWDYLATTGSELVDTVNNQMSDGETVAVANDLTYSTTLDLSGTNGRAVKGHGNRDAVQISYDGAGRAIDVNNADNLTLRDIRINVTSSGVDGISRSGSGDQTRAEWTNVHINGPGTTGVGADPGGWQSTYKHVRVRNFDQGFVADADGQANTVVGLSAVQCDSEAIRSFSGGWHFFGGEASTSNDGVIIVAGGQSTSFNNMHHEGNSRSDYLGESNAIGFSISPRRLEGGSGPAIDLPAPRDFKVELGAARWQGDGTVLKLGDSDGGTTAFRGTVIGNVRDDGSNTTEIDAQDASDVYHYSNTGGSSL